MKKVISFLALLACLFSFPAWAVDCYQNTYGGPVSATLRKVRISRSFLPKLTR